MTFKIDKHGQLRITEEVIEPSIKVPNIEVLSLNKTVELARLLYPTACKDIADEVRIKSKDQREEFFSKLLKSLMEECK